MEHAHGGGAGGLGLVMGSGGGLGLVLGGGGDGGRQSSPLAPSSLHGGGGLGGGEHSSSPPARPHGRTVPVAQCTGLPSSVHSHRVFTFPKG